MDLAVIETIKEEKKDLIEIQTSWATADTNSIMPYKMKQNKN